MLRGGFRTHPPARGSFPEQLFRASRVSLPGPPLHSTVTPHPRAKGEGHNNKD